MNRLLRLLGWHDEWLTLKGEIVKHRPFRWLWIIATAWQLYSRWNAPRGNICRMTFWQHLQYANSMAEMLDTPGEGYLSPSDAIDEDRHYWSD